MQTRSRLTEACALAPAILADETDLVVSNAQATSTGMAIVSMGPTGGFPRFVLKMPMTHQAEEGLRRETRVLANLHADERLGDWRQLIPRPITQGTAGRWVYRVDAALAGAPAADGVAREGGRGPLQETAAETIHFLHRATTRTVHGDRALAERWVDARLHDLWPRGLRRGSLRSRCTRLRDELHGAVLGRALRTSWVHGDFWLGNLLLSQDGSIRGIVDWDAASPGELALHDVMHLLLYTRRMATGQELGLIVRNQLRDAAWPDHELRCWSATGPGATRGRCRTGMPCFCTGCARWPRTRVSSPAAAGLGTGCGSVGTCSAYWQSCEAHGRGTCRARRLESGVGPRLGRDHLADPDLDGLPVRIRPLEGRHARVPRRRRTRTRPPPRWVAPLWGCRSRRGLHAVWLGHGRAALPGRATVRGGRGRRRRGPVPGAAGPDDTATRPG